MANTRRRPTARTSRVSRSSRRVVSRSARRDSSRVAMDSNSFLILVGGAFLIIVAIFVMMANQQRQETPVSGENRAVNAIDLKTGSSEGTMKETNP